MCDNLIKTHANGLGIMCLFFITYCGLTRIILNVSFTYSLSSLRQQLYFRIKLEKNYACNLMIHDNNILLVNTTVDTYLLDLKLLSS